MLGLGKLVRVLGLLFVAIYGQVAGAVEIATDTLVPDEAEYPGGQVLGLGNGGTAASVGPSSLRINPATLVLERQYSVFAGYLWPAAGGEFYNAGVVDGKTSSVAAGVSYSQARNMYKSPESAEDFAAQFLRSPIQRRITIGVGQSYERISIGLGGQYIQARKFGGEEVKGVSVNAGIAGLITPSLRYSVSAENLANQKLAFAAPRTYRAGVAYTMGSGSLTFHADYRQRERLPQELQKFLDGEVVDSQDRIDASEKMLIASMAVRVQNMLQILGGYGHEVGGRSRRSLSGGVALVSNGYTLAYLYSQPYLTLSRASHSVNFALNVPL